LTIAQRHLGQEQHHDESHGGDAGAHGERACQPTAIGDEHGRALDDARNWPLFAINYGRPYSRAHMETKAIKIPGPDHPITVEPTPARVIVKVGGQVIADSRHALTLREARYPGVQYIPRQDVDMSLLVRSDHQTYCPYKGDSAYYSIPAGADRSVNSVWTYESPYPAVAAIKEHLAFYPDRVDSIEVIENS
jgi:uncharacterized protein (DUF427 family)